MEKQSCKTYFVVWTDRDGTSAGHSRDEVGRALTEALGVTPEWHVNGFRIGLNEEYDVDVNNMIRVTLKDLLGKEEWIRDLQTRLGVKTSLEIVPYLVCGSEEPSQYLSLEDDVIEFLYRSHTAMDLDYYIL